MYIFPVYSYAEWTLDSTFVLNAVSYLVSGLSELFLAQSAVDSTHTNFMFKDIVQPKKRGVKKGINRFISTSYTIADAFQIQLKGYSFALNLKKTFSALRAQQTWCPFVRDVRCQKLRSLL
jgi:DNA-binding cell septation regulator SpoVG